MRYSFLLPLVALIFLGAAPVEGALESPQLQKCLKRADDLPDMAALEAQVWVKKGGGNDAHLCRAFAQGNRGMHADAAREFWGLASQFDKTDPARALTMHVFAGQEFLRAKDAKNAQAQFNAALNIVPSDAAALTGRAEAAMVFERYWDALDDLNAALKTDPNYVAALRQRGRVWKMLGNTPSSEHDLGRAAALSGATLDK